MPSPLKRSPFICLSSPALLIALSTSLSRRKEDSKNFLPHRGGPSGRGHWWWLDVFLDLTHPFPWTKLSCCVSSASLNFVLSFQNLKQSTCQEQTTKTRQSWKIFWSHLYWAPKWQNLHPSSRGCMYGKGSTRLCCWSSAPTGQSSSSNVSSDAWGSNRLQALPAHSDTCEVDHSTKHALRCTWGQGKQPTFAISYWASWNCC